MFFFFFHPPKAVGMFVESETKSLLTEPSSRGNRQSSSFVLLSRLRCFCSSLRVIERIIVGYRRAHNNSSLHYCSNVHFIYTSVLDLNAVAFGFLVRAMSSTESIHTSFT